MKGPQWWPLVTVLLAVVHCLALVNQENSDHTNLSPQDSPGQPQNLQEQHGLCLQPLQMVDRGRLWIEHSFLRSNHLFGLGHVLSWGLALSSAYLLEHLVQPHRGGEPSMQEGFQDLSLSLPEQEPQLLLIMGSRRSVAGARGPARNH